MSRAFQATSKYLPKSPLLSGMGIILDFAYVLYAGCGVSRVEMGVLKRYGEAERRGAGSTVPVSYSTLTIIPATLRGG